MRFSKTVIYETALRQNRIDDVIADINQSLDTCETKLFALIDDSSNIGLNDIKQVEIFIAKFHILISDIDLISYDIDQLKQSNYEDKDSILLINNRWDTLLKQARERSNILEHKLEQIKLIQKLIDQRFRELSLLDKQVHDSTIHTKFPVLIERLEYIEDQINKEFADDDDNEKVKELRSK